MTLQAHPVADLFPVMSDTEYADLVADIREHGLREPIWVHRDGRIIDGRNRYRACVEAGTTAACRTYGGADGGLLDFVVSLNLKRRHLNESQRAMVSARIETLAHGQRADLAARDANLHLLPEFIEPTPVEPVAVTRAGAAKMLGVSQRSAASARKVIEHGTPELVAKVDRGEIAVSTAAVIAEAPEDVQRKALAEHDRKAIGEVAKELKQAKQLVARAREPEPVQDPIATPDGTYRCIVIDPPWPMKKIEREERPDQGVELDYPTMNVWCREPGWSEHYDCGTACSQHNEDFRKSCFKGWEPYDETDVFHCASIECTIGHQLEEIADEDCHLYLWVTHKYLPDGIRLLQSWGFNYQCVMTWRKNVGITPFSWMYDTEHVLFARHGNLPLDKLGMRLSFDAPVKGHSVKPDVFYERIAQASPGPRVDMFARKPRDGFTVWGNEVAELATAGSRDAV